MKEFADLLVFGSLPKNEHFRNLVQLHHGSHVRKAFHQFVTDALKIQRRGRRRALGAGKFKRSPEEDLALFGHGKESERRRQSERADRSLRLGYAMLQKRGQGARGHVEVDVALQFELLKAVQVFFHHTRLGRDDHHFRLFARGGFADQPMIKKEIAWIKGEAVLHGPEDLLFRG